MISKDLTAVCTNASYQSSDHDMIEAEKLYQDFEDNLQSEIDNVRESHPGYSHYDFQLDDIGHDPYVLISILSAKNPKFQVSDKIIRETINQLKQPHRQYTLSFDELVSPDCDARERNLPPNQLGRDRLVLRVNLINFGMDCVIDSVLTRSEIASYAAYIRSHGSRPDLFPRVIYPNASQVFKPWIYSVPSRLLDNYQLLREELNIANDFLGYPYIWSGYQPATSFDCSGFICYIMNHLGWSINRTTVQGIYNYCQPISHNQLEPGDLLFFDGTFRANRLTHIGIYIEPGIMLHCGAPGIQYYRLSDNRYGHDEPYHLVSYARLPSLKRIGL